MEGNRIYPLISVIIPAYNVENYLGRCIDSVMAQTYPELEIILVNDGSADRTGQIADEYAAEHAERIKVIHTDNRGVTSARLTGVDVADGEWIGFVDADDEVTPEMYERLYGNACRYQADISHCGHKTIVDEGDRVHEFCNRGQFLCQNREEALESLMRGSFEPSLWTKLFKRSVIEQALNKNDVDRSIVFNEDLLLNYLFFSEVERSVFDDFCGYHYMSRSDSATRGRFHINRVKDPVRVRRIIMTNATGSLKEAAIEKYLTACIHAYISLIGMPSYEDDMHDIRKELIRYRNDWRLLRRNDYIKVRMLMISPVLFKNMYGFYENHIQKKRYE